MAKTTILPISHRPALKNTQSSQTRLGVMHSKYLHGKVLNMLSLPYSILWKVKTGVLKPMLKKHSTTPADA